MKLYDIVSAMGDAVRLIGNDQTEITRLDTDSRKVKDGSLFFCIRGLRVDAHDFAPGAVEAGAAALVFHLAGIESFGVAYLTPFAANAGEQVEGRTVLRQPLPKAKLREAALKIRNRRNQK